MLQLPAVLAALVMAAAPLAVPAAPAGAGPVIDQNFADPDVMKVGRTYYAYATNSDGRNIRWATSTDLVGWTVRESDALPTLGAWVDPDWTFPPGGSGDRGVWAPEVFATGPRSFVMWYTAHDRASGKQCIGAATATSPGGPFVPEDTALVCTPEIGGAIDASSYAESGRRYILWKNDGNCCAQDTWLRLQQVSADGLRRVGAETPLIKQNKPFEGTLVEAPTLVKRGGAYVLFYSANFFGNGSYVSSYATASRLRGPYTKASAPLMTTDAFAGPCAGRAGRTSWSAPTVATGSSSTAGTPGSTTGRCTRGGSTGWTGGPSSRAPRSVMRPRTPTSPAPTPGTPPAAPATAWWSAVSTSPTAG
ncbi:glycoside hydrolase family 43 protein [Actinoplanes sp. CA-252034]|uniref:glycoside hydrolase family 43 protein n=1 Tax=Actinoplanes sp. CA-252034 TaxID=3239906 RepID=UPI003D96A84D